jgi:3-hydroxyacyl-CoA dehydrogenase
MIDHMGVGVVHHVAEPIAAHYLDDHLIQKGLLGVTSGEGFYRYPNPAYEQPEFV